MRQPAAATQDAGSSYVVLAKEGVSADSVAEQLKAAGATVSSVNAAIGMVTVAKAPAGFLSSARGLAGVQGAATETAVGRAPKTNPRDKVLKEAQLTPGTASTTDEARQALAAPSDPLDRFLWGMDMIKAPAAHRIDMGDSRVRVGILDTGVDATHPDLAPNFDGALSRNFVTDMPDIDGPCETANCIDPPTVDDDGHGTHVAGTIAAAMNDVGVSGVAPEVGIVNIRGGQDSGYFFLGPVANALTYAADSGIDVVNLSFYVDPWLYNCAGGAPEDSPESAAQQNLIMAVMDRALNYAHGHNVTLVGALGNNHEDLAKPRVDISSPDYGAPPYPRTISNATCVDLPVEGAHVLGVAALGPSGKKSDFSNYTTQPRSGEIELSAPGGWFRDGFGTPTFMTYPNTILSSAPRKVLQEAGYVDADGNITPDGRAVSIKKSCTSSPAPGATHCGFYQYLQGTSMAAPHASGVAALAVSAHGGIRAGGFGMNPDAVKRLLTQTAINHACPPGGIQSYTNEGRPDEFTATCVGTTAHNGFYGAGIANAVGAVR